MPKRDELYKRKDSQRRYSILLDTSKCNAFHRASFNIRFLYRHLCYIVFYSSLSSSLFCSLHRHKAVYTLLLGALVRRIRHVRANVYIAAVHCNKCEDNAMQWRQWWQC